MLAFQFPPYSQSTGSQRTLAFIRHLPQFGWKPIVITARESAYPHIDNATLQDIPPGTEVLRAWGFDVARKLAVRGIYPRALATPDRWNSWIIGGVIAGLKAVREHRPAALWATFPTPSALATALILRRMTGLPLVGDLRDPMIYETWPDNAWERRVYGFLERRLVRAASAIVVTTPGACRLYRERYPASAEKFHVIPNGMEADHSPSSPATEPSRSENITLLHSGLMEIPDRDPSAFFEAIGLLAAAAPQSAKSLRVILRASGKEALYGEMVKRQGLDDIVNILGRVPRAAAMEEMLSADGLLLFQGKHCNRQIPAKAYEYLFTGKPIVGLMDSGGDTHALVRGDWGVPYCADMDNAPAIARTLEKFIDDVRHDRLYVPPTSLRERHTRRAQTVKFAALLDEIAKRAHA